MKKEFRFSYNWNHGKLNCLCFSTIRLTGRFKPGDQVSIFLGDIEMGVATVIQRKSFLLEQMTPGMAYLDTGYGVEETKELLKRMYPGKDWTTTKVYWYLLRYLVKDNQAGAKMLVKEQPAAIA